MEQHPDGSVLQLVTEICHRALEGNLPLDEFHRIWPEKVSQDPLFITIRSDVEDAVEHFPVGVFTRKLDKKRWQRDDIYLTVRVDCELLK